MNKIFPTPRLALQQPDWPDKKALSQVENELEKAPALITEDEVANLSQGMASVAKGTALLLQGGDCAERFEDAVPDLVRQKVDHLQGLAAAMRASTRLPTVTIGRIAGQYAKPRSTQFERSDSGEQMSIYRGDAVNDALPYLHRRVPDPHRMITSYNCASRVLTEIRRSWFGRSPMERVYASHELLLMSYEIPLVRDGTHGSYASSAHFGWIGERTRVLDGAHLELARSVSNPIGVKIGPSTSPEEAVQISKTLNPEGIPGRLTFIIRAGVKEIDRVLPSIVERVYKYGAPVIWVCDPMHGNSYTASSGHKTRSMKAILDETASFVRILQYHQQWPAGLHLELTADPVTECVDLPQELSLFDNYWSSCDPRLNPDQSAELISFFLSLL